MSKEIKEKIIEILENNYVEDSPDLILELFVQEREKLLAEFEKRIPNVKSINPSYFRDVLKFLRKKELKIGENKNE